MRIAVGNVYSQLHGTERELSHVRKLLSTFAPGFQYTKAYKKRWWNGKVSLLDEDRIPTGVAPFIADKLRAEIVDERRVPRITPKPTSVSLRPYQKEAIDSCLKRRWRGTWWPRGVLHMPTGSGKTITATAIIQRTDLPTLFLVHRRDLVDQTTREFQKHGLDVGVLRAGKVPDNKVIVSTVQSLMSWKTSKSAKSREKEIAIRSMLLNIEQVFVDEAHLVAASLDKGNLFVEALSMMPNAMLRWGLTGTPFIRETYHNLLLEGATGGVAFTIPTQELVRQGYLVKPQIEMLQTNPKRIPNKWPLCYELGIVMNDERNQQIVDQAAAGEGATMVLVNSLAHGDVLYQMLQERVSVRWLRGESSSEERAEAIKELQAGRLKVILASKIWDEGIDIPQIRNLVLAGAGKSKVKTIQRLGRALRLHEGKSTVRVVDFLDKACRRLYDHALERKRTWEDEGHEVDISQCKNTTNRTRI